MSYEQPLFNIGLYKADIDMSNISTWQFSPVWLATSSNIVGTGPGSPALVDKGSLTTPAFGVLQNPCVQDEAGHVVQAGITMCNVKAAITTVGGLLQFVSGGCSPAGSGTWVQAMALNTAQPGDQVAILLLSPYKLP